MAEAAPPRKTTTYNRFSTMASQNERYNTKEDEMFWLENIMRTAPHKLHSVPGPRDVAFFPIPITTCPDQFPGPQSLPIVCCYNVDAGWGNVGTNHHGMFAHADDDGTIWFTISTNTGAPVGTYLPAIDGSTQWHLLQGAADCSITEIARDSLIPFTGYTINGFSGQSPQAGTCGNSDEKCYLITTGSGGISPSLSLTGRTDASVLFTETYGASALCWSQVVTAFTNAWTKYGNQAFCAADNNGAGTHWFLSFPLPAPNGTIESLQIQLNTIPGFSSSMNSQSVTAMHATANYLWVLGSGDSLHNWTDAPTTGYRLYQLDHSFNYVTHYVLNSDPNFSTPWGFHVMRDADLIFMIQNITLQDYTIGYFNPSNATSTVIGTIASLCTEAGNGVGAAGQSGFQYAKNYFYLSYSGFGLGVTNVLKVGPLTCPSNPALPWQN